MVFLDQNVCVVKRVVVVAVVVVNFSHFSSSTQKPLGQFQLNLTLSILKVNAFKFVQTKDHAYFKVEIIGKE